MEDKSTECSLAILFRRLSVGVEEALLQDQRDLAEIQKELIEKADAHLYQAKRSGRNTVCVESDQRLETTKLCS